MTSSQHDPEQEQLDQDMADRQAGLDATELHIDASGELNRRIAEASRRDGARA